MDAARPRAHRALDVWEVSWPAWRRVVTGISFAGWGILLLSTCLIDHWHLFGMRQVLRR